MKRRYLLPLVAILLPASVFVGVPTAAPAADTTSQAAPDQLGASGSHLAIHLPSTDWRLARGRGARTGQAALKGQQAVRVRPGDNLWAIASRTLRTNDGALITRFWRRIYRKNRSLIGDDPNVLGVGQILELPRAPEKAVIATQPAPPKVVTTGTPARNGYRVEVAVRNGNTLWSIADWVLGTNQYDVVAGYSQVIYRANREKIGPDPNLLYPGQVLEIPLASLVTAQRKAHSAQDNKQHDAKAARGQDQMRLNQGDISWKSR